MIALFGCVVSNSATAESSRLDCGREPAAEEGDPGRAWLTLYKDRLGLSLDLRKNGNIALAEFFAACSLGALQRSAELGNMEAEYQHGIRVYLRKPRTADSRHEAYVWIKRAADRGHPRAKVMIATWGPKKP